METRISDHLGRYYTRDTVASLLIRSMNLTTPGTVIDLGAGDGALVTEAANQWTAKRYLTVDIDEQANCGHLPTLRGSSFVHFTGDALDFELARRMGLEWSQACAAVCNPPYIRPMWQKHFGSILEEVGLSHILPEAKNAPAGLLFIAQNLRLLKSGGKLGLIIPDGLITGERFEPFRRALIENHSIEQVIELPRNIFRKTEAQAHIVVLTKEKSQRPIIASRRLEPTGTLSEVLNIPVEDAIARIDYSHHFKCKSKLSGRKAKRKLRDLVSSIARGSYSSSSRRAVDVPILHTADLADFEQNIPSGFQVPPREVEALGGNYASKGDILVARVGRNLSRKVVLVDKGPVLITDCFFSLSPKGSPEEILQLLTSDTGRAQLDRISQGVGARFITAARLLDLELD